MDDREHTSMCGKLGGLTTTLHKYCDQAEIPKAGKVQQRVRVLLLKYLQVQAEIKALRLELAIAQDANEDAES